ncbi:MAG TPA: T9SS type A sorting domain-containing protein [Bacteroidia bacterium]
MKKNVIRMVFLLSMIFVQRTLNAQVVYPPNHSFEDDTSMKTLFPWQVTGKYFFLTSLNMNFATDGKMFIGIESFKLKDKYTNSKVSIKFPMTERVRFLNFQSIFGSQFDFFKFNVKLEFTKFNQFYNRSFVVCSIDSLMDTISNYRSYRNKWNFHKIDLKSHYKELATPDSCYIEFNCDIKYFGIYDFSQVLFLDNVLLTGSVDAQTFIQEQTFSNPEILVYPNPSNGLLNVDLSAVPDVMQLDVISMDGRSVLTQNNLNEIVELDLSALTKGLYLLKITNSDNTQIFKEIVIE